MAQKTAKSAKSMFGGKAAAEEKVDEEVKRILEGIKDWHPGPGETAAQQQVIDPATYISDGYGTFDPNGH